MTRERIEDMREVVLPFVRKRLLETNYENLGESDAEEFAREFNEILDLAIKTLEQEPKSEWSHDHEILRAYADGANNVLDNIRTEIASKITKRPGLNFTLRERERNDAFLEVLDIIEKYISGKENNDTYK